MICWYGDKITPSIKAVYKISGFDYNIHNPECKLLGSVADLENKGVHYDANRKILRDIPLGSQAVFKRYNRATRRFNRVTPSNRGNYKHHLLDNQRKTDRAGVSGQTQSEVTGGNSGSSNAITSENAQKSSSNIDPNGRYSKDDTIFDDFEDEEWLWQSDERSAAVDPDDPLGLMDEPETGSSAMTENAFDKLVEEDPNEAVYVAFNAAALAMVFEVAAVSVSIK